MFTKFRVVTLVSVALVALISVLVAVTPNSKGVADVAMHPASKIGSTQQVNSAGDQFIKIYIVKKPVETAYVVKSGDNLAKIAKKHNITWTSLYCANKAKIGSNPNVVSLGEKLAIPATTVKCKIVLPKIAPPVVKAQVTTTETNTTSSTPTSVPASSSVTSYTPQANGSLQTYALELVGNDSQQFSCLNSIIESESSWNIYAENSASGAFGIPQALPGNKMSVAGADWASNGYTQLKWMVDDYINPTYGSSCNAWEFHLANGYY